MITYIGLYHPWRGGTNPDFDAFSANILELKRGNMVEHFADMLCRYVDASTLDVVCIVPSHCANGDGNGIRHVASSLSKRLGLCDACRCLHRHTTINKLANGGCRNVDVHLRSIMVCDASAIRNKRVLLLDDVTTTGNSLYACRELLLTAGAATVVCFALAQTA